MEKTEKDKLCDTVREAVGCAYESGIRAIGYLPGTEPYQNNVYARRKVFMSLKKLQEKYPMEVTEVMLEEWK